MRTTLLCVFSVVGALGAAPPVFTAAGGSLVDALRRNDRADIAAAAVHGDVNAADENGTPALMHAGVYARLESVALLIDRGANVNAANGFGSTALMWAAPRTPIVRLLLARGADVTAKASDGTTALLVAARVGNVESMRLMVAAGADLGSHAARTSLLTAAYLSPVRPEVREYLRSQRVTPETALDFNTPVLGRQRDPHR